MATDDPEFAKLIDQIQAGSEEAVQTLVDEYGSYLYRAIRRRLNRQIRSQYDSQDFAQAVWASFFRHRETIARFRRPGELAAYLGTMAGNKVIDEIRRRFETEKHNINRERRLESDNGEHRRELDAKIPTPSQFAVANEQFDRLVDNQPAHYRQIIELRAKGATFNEIADELGINEKTARRVISDLNKRIQ